MKILTYLVILSAVLLAVGCAKKDEIQPCVADTNISALNPQIILTISGYEENKQEITHYDLKYFCVDNKKNIYLLNQKTSEILMYDEKGNYISKFGHPGDGPAEFNYATELYCSDDTVCVYDFTSRKLSKFFNNEFLYSSLLSFPIPLKNITPIGKGKFAAIYEETKLELNSLNVYLSIAILDNSLKIINKIKLHEVKKIQITNGVPNLNPLDFKISFAANDSLIYVAKPSTSKYEIDVFDHNGILKNTIKKKYRKIELNKAELNKLDEILSAIRQYGGSSGTAENKNAINALFLDKNGYLLSFNSVFRSGEKNQGKLFVDYFRNDTLINNSIVENFIRGEDLMYFNYQIKFIDDLIYVLDLENSKLTVYIY